jgi:CRISPR/Cas system-associated protein Cas7 (RAMP superfamily)
LSALEGFDVNLQTLIYANGTANKDIAQVLGLSDTTKAVILSVVQEEKVKEILATYEDKYFKTKRGKGVAFTIPISSVIGVMVYKFLLNVNEG